MKTKITVPVVINSNADWSIAGASILTIEEMLEDSVRAYKAMVPDYNERGWNVHYVEVEVEVPESKTVAGGVRGEI